MVASLPAQPWWAGETAEMPGMYAGADYDLAGFAGRRGRPRQGAAPPQGAEAGRPAGRDRLFGGPHSNGYSLIRKIVETSGLGWDAPAPFAMDETLGDGADGAHSDLCESVLPLMRAGLIGGAAHITGGGLIQNPPRAVATACARSSTGAPGPCPPVFGWLQRTGGVEDHELRRTFQLRRRP